MPSIKALNSPNKCILQVLDLLEDACEGLLSHIQSKKFATES